MLWRGMGQKGRNVGCMVLTNSFSLIFGISHPVELEFTNVTKNSSAVYPGLCTVCGENREF